jgi:hypothetical protein
MSAGTYQCFTGAHNRNRNEGCGLESVAGQFRVIRVAVTCFGYRVFLFLSGLYIMRRQISPKVKL